MPYYGKLPIILLSELASGREDSYNCRIAAYLLAHLGEEVSVERIARECYLSKSAVSRFCREVGLEDFIDLRERLRTAEKSFERLHADLPAPEQAARIAAGIGEAARQVADTIDYAALDALVAAIAAAPRVACFGLLKAETAALSLQSDLTMLGKRALTKVSFREQMEFLKTAAPDELAIVFSYKGIYFDYDLPSEVKQTRARLWLVTGNPRAALPAGVEGVVAFASDLDFLSHPYQLMVAATLIAQRYAGAECC